MRDPALCLADQHSYERSAISDWLAINDTSPITGARLTDRRVVTNCALRAVIAALQSIIQLGN